MMNGEFAIVFRNSDNMPMLFYSSLTGCLQQKELTSNMRCRVRLEDYQSLFAFCWKHVRNHVIEVRFTVLIQTNESLNMHTVFKKSNNYIGKASRVASCSHTARDMMSTSIHISSRALNGEGCIHVMPRQSIM